MKFGQQTTNEAAIMILLSTAFVCLALFNYRDLDIGYLPVVRGDDYVWTRSLFHIYHGILNFDAKELFAFPRSYGCIFFYLNFILCLPFLVTKNYEMVIYIPRMLSALFAILSIFYIYLILRFFIGRVASLLVCLVLLLAPFFWSMARAFYPAWMGVSFLLLSLYFLIKDKQNYKKNFWFGVLWYSLALSTKTEYLPFLSMLIFYSCLDFYADFGFDKLQEIVMRFIKIFLVVLLVFVMTNPYLVHPFGLRSFLQTFYEHVFVLNANNHGLGGKTHVIAKILEIQRSYFAYPLLALMLPALFYFVYAALQFRWEQKSRILGAAALTVCLVLFNLLFMVNKNWMAYYLSAMVFLLVLLGAFLSLFDRRIHVATLLFLIALQGYSHFTALVSISQEIFEPSLDTSLRDFDKHVNSSIWKSLRGEPLRDVHILISPYTAFQFQKLGIVFVNLHPIWGALDPSWVHREAFYKTHPDTIKEFSEKKYIILRKNDLYFQENQWVKRADGLGWKKGALLIRQLRLGRFGYFSFYEDDYVLILKRKDA